MKMVALTCFVIGLAFIDLVTCVGIGLALGGDAGGMVGFIVSLVVAGVAGYYCEPAMSEFVR